MRRLWTVTVVATFAWAGTAHATVTASSAGGVLTVTGGSGSDVVAVIPTGTATTFFVTDIGGATPSGGTCAVTNVTTVNCTSISSIVFNGNDGADRLTATGVATAITADGGPADDELHVGTAAGNTLRGGPGNDRLYPGPATNDHVFGGNDPIDSGTADIVDYADVTTGSGYAINLNSGQAARFDEFDDLHGIEGASGSPGDDRITLALGSLVGIDAGGGSGDSIVANPSGGPATLDLQQQQVMQGGHTVFISGFEGASGTGGDDLLVGSALPDTLDGGSGGDDTFRPGAGNDLILDTAGANTLDNSDRVQSVSFSPVGWTIGASESDLANAGAITRVIGGSGDDVLDGVVPGFTSSTGWRFTGGPGNDTLTDDNGAGVLVGGAGNDILDGRAGADDLDGGDGDDRITGGAGQDTIRSGAGADTLLTQDGEVDALICASAIGKTVTADAGDLVGACVAPPVTTAPPTTTTTPTTPTPPTPPTPPGDPIAFKTPTVTRTGTPRAIRTNKQVTAVRTGLTASCAATNTRSCTVVVRLALRTGAKTVLGKTTVTVTPGRRVALTVRLSTSGRARLKRAKRLATAITAGPTSGGVPYATARLTLKR